MSDAPNGGGDAGGFDFKGAGLDDAGLSWVQAKGVKDIAGLVKTGMHAESLVGADKAVLPPKDANGVRDLTKWPGWREHFGVPEAADGYTLPEGVPFTPETLKWFQGTAHKHNLPPTAFAGLVADYNAYAETQMAAQAAEDQARWQANEAGTRELWGAAHDGKMARLAAVLPEPMAQALGIGKIYGLPPEAMAWLDKAAAALSPDGELIGAGGGGGAGLPTPAEAEVSIRAVLNDGKHPYHDARHPDHQKAVDEMARLHRLKRGEKT